LIWRRQELVLLKNKLDVLCLGLRVYLSAGERRQGLVIASDV